MITPARVARHVAIGRRWGDIAREVDSKILADYVAGRPVGTYSSGDEALVDAVKARYEAIGWRIVKEWDGKDRAHEAYDRWTLTFHVGEELVAEAERSIPEVKTP